MGFYWIFPGISQFGKMQQYPFIGQEKPKIFSVMTPVTPSSGISLYQIIPKAVILFPHFFPIVGISLSQLFHNNGILLSLNYPIPEFHCPKLSPSIFPQCQDFQTLNIPNSGTSLSPNFPKTGICYFKIPPIVGFLWYLTFPNTGFFLSLYVPNIRDFIISNLLQRWVLAGFKLTIHSFFFYKNIFYKNIEAEICEI